MARQISILFPRPKLGAGVETSSAPECFADLHLDQIVEAVVPEGSDDHLERFFYAPLRNVAEVAYRHEVFGDLQREDTRYPVESFVNSMRIMRSDLNRASKIWHPLQKQRWFVHAVDVFCRAASSLHTDLAGTQLSSRGLRAVADYLAGYVASDGFCRLIGETDALHSELDNVRYTVHIEGLKVHVEKYNGQTDFSADVAATFERFRREAGRDYHVALKNYPDMNHVEEQILECVAKLYPDTFTHTRDFCERHRRFLDATIAGFDREVQFYLNYLAFMDRFGAAGLSFAYPVVTAGFEGIHAEQAFDLALALKALREPKRVVCNDVEFHGPQRIVVITGPNQGGKTTFARMVGQLAYLAALGCPVPARRAQLMLPEQIFTHFERQESLATLRGKLDNELVRIHDILSRATPRSLIVMNESFASTTVNDSLLIGTEVLERVIALGCVAVYVTFLDELASLDDACVSMVGEVAADDPTVRTFRFTRRPADGLAYATALARKYGLAREVLTRRITQ